MSSQLDELQISLLNDICENASYLQDSDDEIKQRLFDILLDVEFEQLEDENKPKVFNGQSFLNMIDKKRIFHLEHYFSLPKFGCGQSRRSRSTF